MNVREFYQNHIGILFIFIAAFLAACKTPPQAVSLPLDLPQNFSQSGTQSLPDKWWTTFNDPRLNALVDTALANNFNLRTAWQRLVAARAVLDRESAPLLPAINASVQSGINFPRPDFRGGENVRLGLNASYEVDLWGRIRSAVDAQEFRTHATRADYQTAVISVSAQVTQTWFQLTEANNQLDLIDLQLETNQQILQLIENRFGIGQIRSVDILRQRQLIQATREQRIIAETRVQLLEHRLAVLLGKPPQQAIAVSPESLPAPPPVPETGIPIELVRRRPDIQSAYQLIMAADRDLASAISSKYPRLSISASSSLRANNLAEVFKNWAYSFAGNIFAPLFFGGELRAEVDRAEAVRNQRLYEYGQSVLTAFQEVENALVQEQQQIQRIQTLEEQLELARQSNEQLRIGYFNGTSNYLDVLTALGQEQQLRRDILSARLGLLEFRIALYRAIAGAIPIDS